MHHLMIVDDSNVIRNRIERGLESSNIQFEAVATAANGTEAVERFKETKPKFVTMDITMPGMDGLECVQSLMMLDPNVNILVISALSDEYTGLLALSVRNRRIVYTFCWIKLLLSAKMMVESFLAIIKNYEASPCLRHS